MSDVIFGLRENNYGLLTRSSDWLQRLKPLYFRPHLKSLVYHGDLRQMNDIHHMSSLSKLLLHVEKSTRRERNVRRGKKRRRKDDSNCGQPHH